MGAADVQASLKQRVHAVLLAHGTPCPVSDLFGVSGRRLLARLAPPEPWAGTLEASLRLIDELDREIEGCETELRRLGAGHRSRPAAADSAGDRLGARLAQVDQGPQLADATWHMLTCNQPFAPAGATDPLAA